MLDWVGFRGGTVWVGFDMYVCVRYVVLGKHHLGSTSFAVACVDVAATSCTLGTAVLTLHAIRCCCHSLQHHVQYIRLLCAY